MIQVNVSFSTQSRRSIALAFAGSTPRLNPAMPATSTDVSTTPLRCGRFRGFGDNRELRPVPLRPHLLDRVEHLFLRDVFQVG